MTLKGVNASLILLTAKSWLVAAFQHVGSYYNNDKSCIVVKRPELLTELTNVTHGGPPQWSGITGIQWPSSTFCGSTQLSKRMFLWSVVFAGWEDTRQFSLTFRLPSA